jgi:hypothetical protein
METLKAGTGTVAKGGAPATVEMTNCCAVAMELHSAKTAKAVLILIVIIGYLF